MGLAEFLLALSTIFLLLVLAFWAWLEYSNKKFNNFKNWSIKPLKKRWWQNFGDPFQEITLLRDNERIIAATDCNRYPEPFVSFDDYFYMKISLTNERLILSRIPLFMPIKIK